MALSPHFTRCCLGALLVCAATSGCATCRLPAIDPSGERLFLPCPNSTSLATAPGGLFPHPLCPRPAFTTPPQPPACPPGTLPLATPGAPPAPPTQFASTPIGAPVITDRVVLTPARIMARVGDEVVLTCGVCGANGYYITRQPIEWMLSQESVGQFVEVGEGSCHYLDKLLHQTPRKTASNMAKGYTSAKAQQITRGTPSPADDISLLAGQNWISVTSANEGTSYVTAYAPKCAAWDQRKQSAIIHWVDAQWVLPSPAVARAGQNVTLSTRVMRPSGEPIVGWLVRYEVTGGPAAGFAPSNSPAVEVQADAAGLAAVELVPSTNEPGVTQIGVQIIRPAGRGGDSERMVVGRGLTSVNWSAPGLAVKVTGPPVIGIGATGVFRVEVSNPGDLVARDVTASDVLPTGLALVSSNPEGQIFGDRLEWRLGDLPGHTTRVIEITCRADIAGEVQHCVRARSADGNSTDGCAATRLYAPSIKVSMTGPERAALGEQVQFRVDITNAGTKPLTNVTLSDAFDDGFEHVQGGRSPLVNVLGTLAPGETKRVAITFNCVAPGRPCHTLDVSADGEQTARNRACVAVGPGPAGLGGAGGGTVDPPAPGQGLLNIRLTGTRQQRVGEIAEFNIEATNVGGAALTGVRVTYNYPAALAPKEATRGYEHKVQGELTWTIDRLDPGQKLAFEVQCQCLQADPQATSRLVVTSTQRVTAEDQARTEIQPAAGGNPDAGGREPALDDPRAAAAGGALKVTLNDSTDPARVMDSIKYTAILTNDRTASDKSVVVTVYLPDGMTFDKDAADPFGGPVAVRGLGTDGRSAEFTAIAELRAGETTDKAFHFKAKATRPGKYRVRVEVRSQRSPQPVVAEAETTVVGP